MNGQLTLGEALKARGQQKAADAAIDWHEQAIAWITMRVAPFSADDLIAAIGLPNASASNRNNAVGAAFTSARRLGYIRRTGWTTSTRPESHGRVIAVWTRN